MSAYFALKYFSNFNPETEEINFESDEAIIILSTAYIATILFCLIILFAEVGFFESIEGKYLNSLL